MTSLDELLARFRRGPTDVVGIDLRETEIALARLRKGDGEDTLIDARIVRQSRASTGAEEETAPEALDIPAHAKARHGCLTTPGRQAVVKLLSFPGNAGAAAEERLTDNMGLAEPDQHRIGYRVVTEGHGRAETRWLAVAIPEREAQEALARLPSGQPAPYSVEIAGLAAMTAFLRGPGANHADDAIGSISLEQTTTTFALFNKGVLSLIRRFDFGTDSVLGAVQQSLGVDRETAEGIITDGSFDLSQSVSDVMDTLVKQLIISRDFVERRENCRIAKIFATGSLVSSNDCLSELRAALGSEIETWNPFDSLTVPEGALSEEAKAEPWRFSAAVGACLGTFEET